MLPAMPRLDSLSMKNSETTPSSSSATFVSRGVLLTRGHHEVIWTYDPPLFSIGVAMTIVTLVTLQLSIFVKRSRT